MADREVIKGRTLVVRLTDPPECKGGHDFKWQLFESAKPEWRPGSFGVCTRCWRVAGMNCAMLEVPT